MTSRIRSLALAAAALALGSAPAASGASRRAAAPHPMPSRPNVVLIVADDLGYNDIRPYNPASFYDTPNLTRLAAVSTRFADSYAAASICSPSRYALMTGRYPVRGNATDWFRFGNEAPLAGRFLPSEHNDFMPLDETTIANALKARGYNTAFIGKWHLGEDEKYWPEHRGFDINIGGWGAGSPRGKLGYFSPYHNPRLSDGPPGEYLIRREASEAEKVISSFAARKQPFFLEYASYGVHTQLAAPEETIAKYRAALDKSGTPTIFGTERQVIPGEGIRRVRLTQTNVTYAAMVDELDASVGRVLAALELNGLADNTIVIFTSDNGGLSTAEGHSTSNYPLRAGKGWSYEGGLKVPLMVHLPGQRRGRVIRDAAVSGIDLAPTIADYAGAGVLAKADGTSLRPLLAETPSGVQSFLARALYWHYPNYSNQGGIPSSAIRLGRYKLIEDLETGDSELYDVTLNPTEQYDLARTMPETVQRLRELLDRWQAGAHVKFLRAKPGGPQPWFPGAGMPR